jgi:hypothetical protein
MSVPNSGAKSTGEEKRLRQGLWDVYRNLGFDTDGDATPAAVVSDLVSLVVDASAEFRAESDAEEARAARLEAALREMVEACGAYASDMGPACDPPCPMDDTCECPVQVRMSAAFVVARAALEPGAEPGRET